MEKRQLAENVQNVQMDYSPEFRQERHTDLCSNKAENKPEVFDSWKAHFIIELIRNNGFNKTGGRNHWLRDSISELFAKAVEELKKKNGSGITFSNSLPLNNDIQDEFFRLVVEQIHSNIKLQDCILTETGRMTTPDRVFTISAELRELISNQDAALIFDREFISPDVQTDIEILKELGVTKFTGAHLLECLTCTDWLIGKSEEWMAKLYIYLNRNNLDKTHTHTIRRLKTVRMMDGSQASAESSKIFFLPERKYEFCFEKDLPKISEKVLMFDNAGHNARHFLENIGIAEAQADDVIQNHIIPFFRNYKKSSDSENPYKKIHPDYIRYIKEAYINHVNKSPGSQWCLLEDVKKHILLRIESVNGFEYRKPDEIYLSRLYSGNAILEKLFAGIDGISFIHNEYLQGGIVKTNPEHAANGQETAEQATTRQETLEQTILGQLTAGKAIVGHTTDGKIRAYWEIRRKAESWRTFLLAIGVENKPRVTAKKNEVYETSQNPDWCEGRQYIVWNEQISPDIEKILESGTPEQKDLLYRQLEKHMESYSDKLTSRYIYKPLRGILECHGGITRTRFGRVVEGKEISGMKESVQV
jgi:hypothetical protein